MKPTIKIIKGNQYKLKGKTILVDIILGVSYISYYDEEGNKCMAKKIDLEGLTCK